MLLAVPALRALRRAEPRAPLALAAQARIGALLAALGLADRALTFDLLGLDALFTPDRPAPPALAEARRLVCWFGARDPLFARRLAEAAPGALVAPPYGEAGLVWQHLLATAAPDARGDDPALRAPVAVPGALAEDGRRALVGAGWDGARPLALVHPGAGGAAKRWPAEGFARLVERLRARGLAVVLHEGPADRDAVAAVRSLVAAPVTTLVDPPLTTLAGALAAATFFAGNDSGVSHLAAAVGAPALVLFTEAALRWRPWSPSARVAVVRTDRLEAGDVAAVLGAAGDLGPSVGRARPSGA